MRPNPIQVHRKNLGLTQEQLAQRCQITRQVVVRAEQGLFLAPPRSIVGEDDGLRLDYYAWVVEARRSNWPIFSRLHVDSFDQLVKLFGGVGPLCRALVYQRTLIEDYMKKGTGSANICAALRQCGLEEDSLERIFSS